MKTSKIQRNYTYYKICTESPDITNNLHMEEKKRL